MFSLINLQEMTWKSQNKKNRGLEFHNLAY